ncbi:MULTISPECIES: hypothetical protein [unclassified Methanoculleus]|uniref:hypothetical protein n=1 Tax=unclassified Methanoculleus TaxID=2619537 RepID=UPI00319E017D
MEKMSQSLQEGIITFDANLKSEILSCFGKTVDDSGYIVERDDPSQRVLTPDGEDITLDEFAGIRKGSEIFIKADLPSLIELLDTLE